MYRLVEKGCRIKSVGGVIVEEVVGEKTTKFVVENRNKKIERIKMNVI